MNTDTPIHNRFDEIHHLPLRIYNRVVMMTNLQSISREEAIRYAKNFTKAEQTQMGILMAYIKQYGAEATRKSVTKGLKIHDQ